MDVQRYEVTYGEDRIELTHREFELLRVLLENKNIVISRETLLEKICAQTPIEPQNTDAAMANPMPLLNDESLMSF